MSISPIVSAFASLSASLETDEEAALLPAFGTAVVNLAVNPTKGNLIAQGVILLDTAIAAAFKATGALTPLVSDLSGALSTIAQSSVNAELAKLTAKKPG